MNWILDMARRNIKRNKRRTILAASSIALAVMLMTFLGGMISGILDNMVRNLTRSDMGHVRIVSPGFESRSRFMPVDELVPDPEAVMATIRAIPDLPGTLVTVTDRIMFGTLLSNGPSTKAAVGFAGDAAAEAGLMDLDRSIVEGRYLSGSGETILGKKLAADLGFDVGETMLVVSQGADYGLHLKRFTIVGLFSTGLNQLDGSFFQVPIADAKAFLRTEGGSQQVLVMLDNYRKADDAAARIREALSSVPVGSSKGSSVPRGSSAGSSAGSSVPGGSSAGSSVPRGSSVVGSSVPRGSSVGSSVPGVGSSVPGDIELLVQPWTKVGEYPALIKMMETIYNYIFVVVAMLGAFIITNILMMVVLERKKEIGILKAMGLQRLEVLGMFLAEGALMGAIGSGIGAVLGMVICYIMSIYGFDFSDAMGSLTMPIDPIFYTRFDLMNGVIMFTLGFLVSIAMSVTPSRRAATMNAVDAIKSVA
jgi:ABC-type lipoprotein release transport system permease subunit